MVEMDEVKVVVLMIVMMIMINTTICIDVAYSKSSKSSNFSASLM